MTFVRLYYIGIWQLPVVRDPALVSPCQLGRRWFGDGQAPSAVRVDDADVGLEQAVRSAAARLCEAARPLVCLAPGLSCEAQREAVAIADLLRARLDSFTSSTALASM